MSALTVRVPGMTCRHCVRKVTAALRDVPGVELVQADLATTTVVLRGEPALVDVLAGLNRAGFPGTVLPGPRPHPDPSAGADAATDAPADPGAAPGALPG